MYNLKMLANITPVIVGYSLLSNKRGQQAIRLNLAEAKRETITSGILAFNARDTGEGPVRMSGQYAIRGGVQDAEFQQLLKIHGLTLQDFTLNQEKSKAKYQRFTCNKPTPSEYFVFSGRPVTNRATGETLRNFCEVDLNVSAIAAWDAAQAVETPTLAWGKKELLAFAQSKGVEVKSTSTKPQILEAIKAHF